LVILGGGPVGVTAAVRASALGHSAILVDATPRTQFQFTGPTGLFSKALRDASLRLDVSVLRSMGIGDAAIWRQVRELIDSILMKAGSNNARALSQGRVPHLRGVASLVPPDKARSEGEGCVDVEVAFTSGASESPDNAPRTTRVRARHALIATGSSAVRLDALAGLYNKEVAGHVRCFDSDSIKSLGYLPRSAVIVGGGIIAVEFARIFAALGARVTMVVRASDLASSLRRVGIDAAVAFALQAELQAAGVRILFDSQISSWQEVPAAKTATASTRRRSALPLMVDLVHSTTGKSSGRRPIDADLVFTATGRSANTGGEEDALGLRACGAKLAKNGDVLVDSRLRATDRIYAAGDVIGAPQLASTGLAQAESAVDAMFTAELLPAAPRRSWGATAPMGGEEEDMASTGAAAADCSPEALLADAARYPVGIWTIPEVAFVGLTAEAARAPPHNMEVVEGIGRYSASIRGHVHAVGTSSEGEYLRGGAGLASSRGFTPFTGQALKIVATRTAPHTVVGVHIFGEDACELIHLGQTLVQGKRTLTDTLSLIFTAVTYHELFQIAARDALSSIASLDWTKLYRRLAAAEAAEGPRFGVEAARAELEGLGASPAEARAAAKVLFANDGRIVSEDIFVARAARTMAPLNLVAATSDEQAAKLTK